MFSDDVSGEPPHSLDAERNLIADAIQRTNAEHLATLTPEHFYSESHRHMVRAIQHVVASGRLPTVTAVVEALHRSGARGPIGEALSDVLRLAPGFKGIAQDVEIVRTKAHARRIALACANIQAAITLGRLAPSEAKAALDRALGTIDTIQRPRVRIWTPEEIWAPLPPADYLVGGMLLRSSVAMICATGSSLKTWALADLVIATATGTEWLGRFPCKAGRTLLVDWESGDYELRRRLQRISAGRGLTGPVAGVEFVTMPDLFFSSADFAAQVETLAAGRALVAFDSLAAGSAGADENDARFAYGLNVLKGVATKTACAFVVLHHSRKGSPLGDGDARDKPRGTSALFAACDVVLQLSKSEEGTFRVNQTKARAGKAADPFILRVDDVGEDASIVRGANLPVEGLAATEEPIDRAKARVLRLVADSHDLKSKNEICRRLKGTKKVTLDAISELEERGLIRMAGDSYKLSSEMP